MSDQATTGMGAILGLEDLFLSQEFGRRPARFVTAPASVVSQPAQLEEVFLSEVFGRPEAVAEATRAVEESAPAATAPPALVLLQGGAANGRSWQNPHHRTIAAVSGVAAAALAVAGMASGTGRGPARPASTPQALGTPPSQVVPGSDGASSASAPSGAVSPVPSSSASLPTRAAGARLISLSTPAPTAPTSPVPIGGVPSPGSPPASGGGAGGGAGGMLVPELSLVGSQVSVVGSSVTAATGSVGQALATAPVVQSAGTGTSAGNASGAGSPTSIVANSL